jgi:hypothetical protein
MATALLRGGAPTSSLSASAPPQPLSTHSRSAHRPTAINSPQRARVRSSAAAAVVAAAAMVSAAVVPPLVDGTLSPAAVAALPLNAAASAPSTCDCVVLLKGLVLLPCCPASHATKWQVGLHQHLIEALSITECLQEQLLTASIHHNKALCLTQPCQFPSHIFLTNASSFVTQWRITLL